MKISMTSVVSRNTVDLPYLNYNSLLIAFASSHVIDANGREVSNLDLLDIIRRAEPGKTLFPNWAYGHSVIEYLFEKDAFYSPPDSVRIRAFDLITTTRPEESDYELETVIDFGGELMNHVLQNYRHDYVSNTGTFIPEIFNVRDLGCIDVISDDIFNEMPSYKEALNALDPAVMCQFADTIYKVSPERAFSILIEAITRKDGQPVCDCTLAHIQEYVMTPDLRMAVIGYITAGVMCS